MNRIRRRHLFSLGMLATLATLAGCAGNGEGLDQNGRPGSPGSALTPTFNSIQDNVFTPVCTKCHAGAGAPQGLRLDTGNSYALLVGMASAEVPSLQRVKPGDPGASYLIQKIRGTAAVGLRMPLDGPPYLPQATIDVISQWVANGAPRPTATGAEETVSLTNTGMTNTGGLQIAMTAPSTGDVVAESLSRLVVGFNQDLDVNLANASTVSLERLDTNSQVATTLSVPVSNPSTLVIDTREPLSAGTYRLVLRGSGGGALAGLDSRPLNARRENAPGEDSTIEFTVKVQQ